MMLIDPYQWGVRGPASLELKGGTDERSAVANITTFDPITIGSDAPRRRVFVSLFWLCAPGAPSEFVAMKINGHPATLHIESEQGRYQIGNAFRAVIASAEVQGGSSATVSVEWSINVTWSRCWVYRADNVSSGVALDAGRQRTSVNTYLSVDLDVAKDGFVMGVGGHDGVIWSGITQDFTDGLFYTGGSALTPTSGTRTVAFTAAEPPALDMAHTIAAASFR